ncbi:MAG: hypothetical protein KatS3mg129_0733 [Leptospiraceae bacterium]|nr:MAG: hypothetical protein KatS3mg129_0733 [Leptospiraceae bacterium]
MTTKKYIIKNVIIILFYILLNEIYSEPPAQKYLELLNQKNQFYDGYYEGNFTFLFPFKKKEIYDFIMLQKGQSIFWEIKKNGIYQYRLLCKKEYQQIYFYDRRRDVLKQYKEKNILKDWNYIPLFLLCNLSFEFILDPLKIEKNNNEFFIYGNFFFPETNRTTILHFNSLMQYKKLVFYRKINNVDSIDYRIFYFYDDPISMLKNKQIQTQKVDFYTRLEIIHAITNSVILIKWFYFNPDYKIDDIRFMPEFISR